MQNRYAGDIGDFGKLLLLLEIASSTNFKLGINWYLNLAEEANTDGRFTLENYPELEIHAPELFKELLSISKSKERTVESLQSNLDWPVGTQFFAQSLTNSDSMERRALSRISWHQSALEELRNCELVFLDPDNGLPPHSVKSYRSKKHTKYAYTHEIGDYLKLGISVILYQHRDRSKRETYYRRLSEIAGSDFNLLILDWTKVSRRSYACYLLPDHFSMLAPILTSIANRLPSFEKIDFQEN